MWILHNDIIYKRRHCDYISQRNIHTWSATFVRDARKSRTPNPIRNRFTFMRYWTQKPPTLKMWLVSDCTTLRYYTKVKLSNFRYNHKLGKRIKEQTQYAVIKSYGFKFNLLILKTLKTNIKSDKAHERAFADYSISLWRMQEMKRFCTKWVRWRKIATTRKGILHDIIGSATINWHVLVASVLIFETGQQL